MNQITIDKKFFDLNSDISKGLITGLKKLQQNGFVIRVDDFNVNEKAEINKILEMEEIILTPKEKTTSGKERKKLEKNFSISAKQNNEENSVIVTERSEINTFEKGVNQILKFVRSSKRRRNTKETDIEIEVNLDGTGGSMI